MDDPDIKELKELVQRNVALAEDTNRIVHKLRRNVWWGRLWSIVWWGTIIIASGAAYYLYAQPYVEQAMGVYNSAQGWQVQIQDFFAKFGSTTVR